MRASVRVACELQFPFAPFPVQSSNHLQLGPTSQPYWAEVINVNLNGTFYCTSAALPTMINQRFGRIINISSMVGQAGVFGQANYSASKGGIIAFTKTLALEMAKYNITANSIAPGYTSTEMVDAIPEEVSAQIKARIPLGRCATPEEVAKAAALPGN
jgi:acetoacetyl-CoA reductase/3-oxoacyl-[acyl-carrier protein] reductase